MGPSPQGWVEQSVQRWPFQPFKSAQNTGSRIRRIVADGTDWRRRWHVRTRTDQRTPNRGRGAPECPESSQRRSCQWVVQWSGESRRSRTRRKTLHPEAANDAPSPTFHDDRSIRSAHPDACTWSPPRLRGPWTPNSADTGRSRQWTSIDRSEQTVPAISGRRTVRRSVEIATANVPGVAATVPSGSLRRLWRMYRAVMR